MRKNLCGLGVFIFCMSLAGLAFGLTPIQKLGEKLYFDTNLSSNGTQSCASCHDPASGFVDPDNNIPVSAGAIHGLFGGRNSPSAAYAAFSPAFRFDEVSGLYVGGQFWDGREPSLAGQAAGPFRNPVEMAMPDKKSVIRKLKRDWQYYRLFREAFSTEDGPFNLLLVFPYSNQNALATYDLMAKAIGEFEKTQLFNKFNSRFDYYVMAGEETLTEPEARGLTLFEGTTEGMAKCVLCHITEPGIAPDGGDMPPLLTDFTYDNLGIPKNGDIEVLIGGPQEDDKGLGAVLGDPAQDGKFKVMSLRNIALTAPYGHNGYFPNLESIVQFYNTRDTLKCDAAGLEDATPATTADLADMSIPGWTDAAIKTCWPAPEVPANMNTSELGHLGLSVGDVKDIVAFMNTLSDRDNSVSTVFDEMFFPPSP